MHVRTARTEDDLTALWPECREYTLNREQVFLAVDEQETVLAGLLMFHGGHSLAYAGSIVFISQAHQGQIATKLIAFVKDWGRAHGVTKVGHGAGTTACCEAFLKLGSTITRYHALMELQIDPVTTF